MCVGSGVIFEPWGSWGGTEKMGSQPPLLHTRLGGPRTVRLVPLTALPKGGRSKVHSGARCWHLLAPPRMQDPCPQGSPCTDNR